MNLETVKKLVEDWVADLKESGLAPALGYGKLAEVLVNSLDEVYDLSVERGESLSREQLKRDFMKVIAVHSKGSLDFKIGDLSSDLIDLYQNLTVIIHQEDE